MYALCVAGAVNTQVFVSKFFMRYILFIHSFNHIHVETPQAKTFFFNGYEMNPVQNWSAKGPKSPNNG